MIRVTQHAIDRYRERTGSKNSDAIIEGQLRSFCCCADEVKLKPEYRVIALLDHGLQKARYLKYNQFILVIVDGELRTVHHGQAKRWQHKVITH